MKRILSSLMAGLLIVFMFSTTVSAAQKSSMDIESLVDSTNSIIEQEIIKAQTQANDLTRKYISTIGQLENAQKVFSINNQANINNEQLVEEIKLKYDNNLDNIVNRLIQKTNDIANDAIRIAAENGYTVICEMVEVEVGNRFVLIDPLRVSDI
ncbi:MAG: hypothetical protein K0R09_2485 [Clostridiales bacterium]|nr:hypothetical protein [Clostridiales bacterium]